LIFLINCDKIEIVEKLFIGGLHMGFLKNLGTVAGSIAGTVIGGTVGLVGEAVDSKFLKEVGEGVYQVSKKSGQLVGSFAEGTFECASGILTDNKEKVSNGFEQIVDATSETVVNVGRGMVNVVGKSIETVDAIIKGDNEKALEVGKDLVKVLAIGFLAVGVVDMIDGFDGFDGIDTDDTDVVDASNDGDYLLVDNDATHHVTPHYRTLSNGSEIWVDGDGDTSVDTGDGWTQHNPDFRVSL